MHVDIKTRLQDTTPEQLPPLDHEGLQRRGRRRRHVKRAGTVTVVAAVVVAAVVAIPWPGGNVTVEDGFAGPGDETPADSRDRSNTAQATPWEDLSVTEATDRLIAIGADHESPAAEPPPPGKMLRLHEVYVTQERLDDGTARWAIQETRSDITSEEDVTVDGGYVETELPHDAGRDEAIRFVAEQRPSQLEPLDDAGIGYGFHDDGWLNEARQVIEENLTEGRLDAETTHAAAFDAETRRWILEQFAAHPEVITYEGVVTDVLGRDAVVFSAANVGPQSLDAGTARVLFDPATGQPSGWEYGGGDIEWRIEATVTYELMDAG